MDRTYLDIAARAALRALGRVEPNPMVGCALVRDGRLLAVGHHQRFGDLHAEREALAACRARNIDPRGATAYVTLEPCHGHGKQPPCTEALVHAGIARVVYAVPDPSPAKSGGAAFLRASGIHVDPLPDHELSHRLSGPFIKRITTGLPWVSAKWAQTIDGRIATRTGQSQWISSPASRARVHRLRAVVDVILTGLGTVLADDPYLTARLVSGARDIRRIARRVVIDSKLMTPPAARLIHTAREVPTTIITTRREGPHEAPWIQRRQVLLAAGADIIEAPANPDGEVDLHAALLALAATHNTSTVLVEAGPRLLGSLLAQSLIDEAIVHLAPLVLADDQARAVASGKPAPLLSDASRWRLQRSRPTGDDIELWYRRATHPI